MPKLHTRQKRQRGIASHTKGKRKLLLRKKRPKTFLTEEKAKAYAEKNNMQNYEIKRLKFGLSKKLKIVQKL